MMVTYIKENYALPALRNSERSCETDIFQNEKQKIHCRNFFECESFRNNLPLSGNEGLYGQSI